MSKGLQLLGSARSVRSDQFQRPKFDSAGAGQCSDCRPLGADGLSPGKRANRTSEVLTLDFGPGNPANQK